MPTRRLFEKDGSLPASTHPFCPLRRQRANIKNGNYDGQRVMLIVKSPVTLVEDDGNGMSFCL